MQMNTGVDLSAAKHTLLPHWKAVLRHDGKADSQKGRAICQGVGAGGTNPN